MVWVLIMATVAGALLSSTPSLAESLRSGRLSRSDTCGECHRDIYRMWRASAHARAMEDPVFLDAYRQTEEREGTEVAGVCLDCHAPAVALTKDFKLAQKISWEGVGCDICHSIASVDTTGAAPKLKLDVGTVKRGPIKDASSTAHEVLYSQLHTEALACMPCHEFANSEGTPLMTTYSEWKESRAGKAGKSCQACHMGKTKANVVDPIIARVPEAEVNLHEVPGGHSIDQLNKALEVRLLPKREANSLRLDVRLRNKGAGHAVPTGMPGRQVILSVKVRTTAGGSFEDKRTYGKRFLGAGGGAITRDSSYFARGVRLASDTRIKADEERTESFRVAVPSDATAFLTCKIQYEHAPTGTDANRTLITFYSEERTLLPEKPRNP